MKPIARAAALSLLIFAILALSGFVRETTTSNLPLFWAKSAFPLPFQINQAGAKGITDGSDFTAVRQSFNTWTQVGCASVTFADKGLTDRTTTGNALQPDPTAFTPLVVFRGSQWNADGNHPSDVIALTTNIFNTDTGEILHSDIELNNENFTFTTFDPPSPLIQTDIRNTLTHEAGHFLGLDHSADPGAVMYARAPPGETSKRTLGDDDIRGICTIYSNGTTPGFPGIDGGGSRYVPVKGDAMGCTQGSAAPMLAIFALIGIFIQARRRD